MQTTPPACGDRAAAEEHWRSDTAPPSAPRKLCISATKAAPPHPQTSCPPSPDPGALAGGSSAEVTMCSWRPCRKTIRNRNGVSSVGRPCGNTCQGLTWTPAVHSFTVLWPSRKNYCEGRGPRAGSHKALLLSAFFSLRLPITETCFSFWLPPLGRFRT